MKFNILFCSIINALTVLKLNDLFSIFQFLVISTLIIIMFVDLKDMIIPDTLIIFNFVIIVIYFVCFKKTLFENFVFNSFEIIGALVLNVILFLVLLFIQQIFKKEVMGYGDIKLLLVFGLMIGITKLLFVIFISSLLALIYESLKGIKKNEPFPFGPYLIIGFMISYFCFDKLYILLFR